ncbi:MAG: helix-turn-helix domain-containing protein [bacterium]|nr:helix-turn-helix domain-containing protein [bacterium]
MTQVINPARIVSEVEYEHGLKPGTLASRTVSKFVSGARRKAILLLREGGLSWPEIARMLQRDHTSVMRMIKPARKK